MWRVGHTLAYGCSSRKSQTLRPYVPALFTKSEAILWSLGEELLLENSHALRNGLL
jgi:hypothetical protein